MAKQLLKCSPAASLFSMFWKFEQRHNN